MRYLLLIAFAALYSGAAAQQGTFRQPARTGDSAAIRDLAVPDWAQALNYDATAHAYFPDYYTYYDPVRGGYSYWQEGQYVFSNTMPTFMQKADLSKSRIRILKGLSLDLHPEQNYPYYMKLYPADPNNNVLVPVPVPGNPAGR
jgi:hypothetical protein